MCGIVGHVDISGASVKMVSAMNLAQNHRGPDARGSFISRCSRFSLASTRLSITDVRQGDQPMSIEDGRFTIVFNGEIFNARQLREELIRNNNEPFSSTHSDTEVVIRLFKEYGVDSFKKLNGMFAVAIFSRDEQKVTLARDAHGIKPLIYKKSNGGLFFASELQAFKGLTSERASINMKAISEYMDFGYIISPNTVFSGINRLMPGHFAEFYVESDSLDIKPWTRKKLFNQENQNLKQCDIQKKVFHHLKGAVERWSSSDFPVCYSLSGGLDSSALAALASVNGAIDTYSVGYRTSRLEKWDEAELAKKISTEIGSRHHEIIIDLSSIEEDLFQISNILNEPYGGGLPSYYLFREASKSFKVIMTGIGGDELFGNYSNALRYQKYFPNNKNFNMKNYIELMYNGVDKSPSLKTIKSRRMIELGWQVNDNLKDELSKIPDIESSVECVDLALQLPNEFLHMTDILSMQFSIEARTPFLDQKFSDYMETVPMEFKNTPNSYKSLLVKSLRDYIPKNALNVPKRGFSLPLSILMRDTLRSTFDNFVNFKTLKEVDLYHEDIWGKLIHPFLNGDNRFVATVWRIFMLQIWWHKNA